MTSVMVGSDPDGDDIGWIAEGLPPGLSIDNETGVVSGVIGFDADGSYEVVVSAIDDGSPQLT